MKCLIGGPKCIINQDIKKNLVPLATTEAIKNITKLISNTPAVIVINLYGIGVNPAVNTTQKSYSAYIPATELNASIENIPGMNHDSMLSQAYMPIA